MGYFVYLHQMNDQFITDPTDISSTDKIDSGSRLPPLRNQADWEDWEVKMEAYAVLKGYHIVLNTDDPETLDTPEKRPTVTFYDQAGAERIRPQTDAEFNTYKAWWKKYNSDFWAALIICCHDVALPIARGARQRDGKHVVECLKHNFARVTSSSTVRMIKDLLDHKQRNTAIAVHVTSWRNKVRILNNAMPEGKLGKDLEAVLFLESLSSAYATFHDLQIMKPSLEPSKLYEDVIDYAGSAKSIDGERQ